MHCPNLDLKIEYHPIYSLFMVVITELEALNQILIEGKTMFRVLL